MHPTLAAICLFSSSSDGSLWLAKIAKMHWRHWGDAKAEGRGSHGGYPWSVGGANTGVGIDRVPCGTGAYYWKLRLSSSDEPSHTFRLAHCESGDN